MITMTIIDQLRKEMMDAKEAYEIFQINNSRELTDKEKENHEKSPEFFLGIVTKDNEVRMFELTMDNVDEFRELSEKMRTTRITYMKEYMSKK